MNSPFIIPVKFLYLNKESDRLAALREISALQRMKNEAKIEEEKRVNFYIPLSFDRCQELLSYLHRYFEDKKD